MQADVIVVGGGTAGLSTAMRLHARGIEVVLLEAEDVPGGNVRTEVVDGFRLERGPHTFMASADDIFALAGEAGLEDALTASRPAADSRFIVRGGKLHCVPTGLWSFLTTNLIGPRAKLDLLTEPFRTGRGDPSETAAQFFDRRFGPEAARVLAGAFISGVYAGDPQTLSAPAAFPLFWRFEQESGGMIRGGLAMMRERRAKRKALGETGGPRRKGLYSCHEGLGQISTAVAAALNDRCLTGERALSIGQEGGDFSVSTNRETHRARQLVIAVPPAEAARLLREVDADLDSLIGSIPMAPVAVVYLGYERRRPEVPEGFGFLVPRGEGTRTLGVLFPSRLFDGRTPGDGDLLTGYVGGMLDKEAMNLTDDQLVDIVLKDLEQLLGLTAKPCMIRTARHPQAIPQLVLGHLERMEKIKERLRRIPGLHLAGNYLRGVGIKDAVASGFLAAEEIHAIHHERSCER